MTGGEYCDDDRMIASCRAHLLSGDALELSDIAYQHNGIWGTKTAPAERVFVPANAVAYLIVRSWAEPDPADFLF